MRRYASFVHLTRPTSPFCLYPLTILVGMAVAGDVRSGFSQANAPDDVFARENLVAWCIVPFDARNRNPEQRAAMLRELGLRRLAYDWREEHVPQFEAEIAALKSSGIELVAWWFPLTLDAHATRILDLLKKHNLKIQLWVSGFGSPMSDDPAAIERHLQQEVARIRTIATAAAQIDCVVGLYNHGGWYGEPENQIAIIERVGMPNVGIVYNLHHGHDHLDRFSDLLEIMKPHLLAINLNGMEVLREDQSNKILPLGAGSVDLKVVKGIRESSYSGPIGILNHTDHDAAARLRDNLAGLEWLVRQLACDEPSPRPTYETWPDDLPLQGEKK